MPSNIDPTQPPQGAATTAALRANFLAAKTEIEALQEQVGGFALPAVGGTANAITLTNAIPVAAYSEIIGRRIVFQALFTNTSASPTINIDGLGPLPLLMGAGAVPAGDILAGRWYWLFFESAIQCRIAPFDAISSEGDTVNGNLLITGRSIDTKIITPVTAAVGTTYAAADFINGYIKRSGPGANFSDTTPAAADIIAALGKVAVGSAFTLQIINLTNRMLTLLAGAGITLDLTTTIAAAQNRDYLLTVTGILAPAITITGLRTSNQ